MSIKHTIKKLEEIWKVCCGYADCSWREREYYKGVCMGEPEGAEQLHLKTI